MSHYGVEYPAWWRPRGDYPAPTDVFDASGKLLAECARLEQAAFIVAWINRTHPEDPFKAGK